MNPVKAFEDALLSQRVAAGYEVRVAEDLVDRARMRAYDAEARGGFLKMLQAIELRYNASHGAKRDSIISFLRQDIRRKRRDTDGDMYSKQELSALRMLLKRLEGVGYETVETSE